MSTSQSTSEADLFIDLVARMRAAQKEYFKTRDKEVLARCKALEREVDLRIGQQHMPDLF